MHIGIFKFRSRILRQSLDTIFNCRLTCIRFHFVNVVLAKNTSGSPLVDTTAIPEVLADSLGEVPIGFNLAGQCFFQVVCRSPEARTTVRVSHLQKKLSCVRCQPLEIVQVNGTNPIFRPMPELAFELDIQDWASVEQCRKVFSTLRIWSVARHGLRIKAIQDMGSRRFASADALPLMVDLQDQMSLQDSAGSPES